MKKKIVIFTSVLTAALLALALVSCANNGGEQNITAEQTTEATTEQTTVTTTEPFTGADYREQGGRFELPVSGSTGWAAASTPLLREPRARSNAVRTLTAGQAFIILEERGGRWLRVQLPNGRTRGWVAKASSFINLPDVLPSIVYNISNARASVMRSSETDIPRVTGEALYSAFAENARLGREEYIVPVLYETAARLAAAQVAALSDGNTIIVYEAFRPHETQRRVVNNLRRLMRENAEVNRAITSPPWGIEWFVATSLSNHQRGSAIDASLGRIVSSEPGIVGDFGYTRVTEVEEFEMPTAMHELSSRAAIFARPVMATSPDAWRDVPLSENATEGARLLQRYFVEAGFTPLASEWWHFNDLEGTATARTSRIYGRFFTESVYSTAERLEVNN